MAFLLDAGRRCKVPWQGVVHNPLVALPQTHQYTSGSCSVVGSCSFCPVRHDMLHYHSFARMNYGKIVSEEQQTYHKQTMNVFSRHPESLQSVPRPTQRFTLVVRIASCLGGPCRHTFVAAGSCARDARSDSRRGPAEVLRQDSSRCGLLDVVAVSLASIASSDEAGQEAFRGSCSAHSQISIGICIWRRKFEDEIPIPTLTGMMGLHVDLERCHCFHRKVIVPELGCNVLFLQRILRVDEPEH